MKILELLFNLYFLCVFNDLTLDNGLVLDRSLDRQVVSCASTGFVSYSRAHLIALEIAPKKDVELIKNAFKVTTEAHPEARGWLYHFTDHEGKDISLSRPEFRNEISTIDTAIFYFSMLRAAELLNDDHFLLLVKQKITEIDLQWMLDGEYFIHGRLDNEKLTELWDDYNEGVILYDLFNLEFKEKEVRFDLPLFVYYYPLIFKNKDQYKKRFEKAIEWQKKNYGYVGVTACDSPWGYQVNSQNIVSPLSAYICGPSDLPLVNSVMLEEEKVIWKSEDRYGIDWGSYFLMIQK